MTALPAIDFDTDPIARAFEQGHRAVVGARDWRVLTEYRERPEDFCVEILGIPRHTLRWSLNEGYKRHQWDGTREPIVAMLEALARGEDVGVEAATGTQKSYTGACVVLWFLACWEGARVFTFAPKEDQLRLFIWAEIGKLWPRFTKHFPQAELTDLRIRMRPGSDEWAAFGYSVAVKAGEVSSTNAQGMHAPHMLIITEETPGIAPAVIEAHRNTCTGDHNLRLALGNPDSQQDTLHQICTEEDVTAIRISGLDHPNVVTGREVVPGAVTRKANRRRLSKYGEDHRLYKSRVRGLSPEEAQGALIKMAWVRAAQARYGDLALRKGPPARGVDVANSEAGDDAAISYWLGACCLQVPSFKCPDANVLGSDVVTEARASGVLPTHVGVDSVGVGAGAVNEAKRLGFLVRALQGGETRWLVTRDEDMDVEDGERGVVNEERFVSLRAQMWWQLAQDLQHGRIALPADEEMAQDLVTPEWETRGGKIVVEPKEKIRERLGRSPNKGDAVVYGNWVRDRSIEVPEPPEISAFSPEILALDAERKRKLSYRLEKRRKLRRQANPDSLIG